MDTLTHISLGIVLSEGTARKTLGKSGLLLGTVFQLLPDCDVVAALWVPSDVNLHVHRGITHSIFFATLAASAFAYVFYFVYKKRVNFMFLFLFLLMQILSHIFLDLFNAYGVGWLEPFSREKLSLHTLFVADPLFTIWLSLAAVICISSNKLQTRKWAVVGSLVICTAYILLARYNRGVVKENVASTLKLSTTADVLITPSQWNTLLWYVVVPRNTGFHVGYSSVFDKPGTTQFTFHQQHRNLLDGFPNETLKENLTAFSQGFYTVEADGDTLIFNDLRFGQIAGWENPENRFVFHYYLNDPRSNRLVMQRGRFQGWNQQSMSSFFRRLRGYTDHPVRNN